MTRPKPEKIVEYAFATASSLQGRPWIETYEQLNMAKERHNALLKRGFPCGPIARHVTVAPWLAEQSTPAGEEGKDGWERGMMRRRGRAERALTEHDIALRARLAAVEGLLREMVRHLLSMKEGAHNCAACGLLYERIVSALAGWKEKE